MKAVLKLELSDEVVVGQDNKKDVVREVKTSEHLAIDVSVDREEIQRAFQNTVAMSLASLFDKTFNGYDKAIEAAKKAFAEEFGCRAYEQYEQMASDPRLEGIIVMSSNAAHERDVTLAASKGKHIFVTKPIATTIAAAKKMIAVCEHHDAMLAVEHQTRREPALRKLKEILGAGDLGDVRLVEANYSTPNGDKQGFNL